MAKTTGYGRTTEPTRSKIGNIILILLVVAGIGAVFVCFGGNR